MGKTRKKTATLEEILERPWCYYCEKDFDDLSILLSHQKAKHYKCHNCHRRLNTIGGLKVHMNQVHKEEIHEVENALPKRKDIIPNQEIFAMEGIPEDVVKEHKQKITEMFFKRAAEHRLKTGNPPPGQAQGGANGERPSKRPKIETPEEIKARLAEHRKKRAAEKAARQAGLPVSSEGENNNSHEGTPANGSGFNAPADMMPPAPATLPSAGVAPPFAFTSSPANAGFSPYTAPPPQTGFSPVGQPPFAQPPAVFSPTGIPPQAMPPMPPMPPQPFGVPPLSQAPPAWSPNGQSVHLPYSYDGRAANNDSPSFGFRPPVSSTSQRQGSGPPPNAPGMQPGLPSPAPGLPQRPSFQAPNLSREEMAQMHTGHYSDNLHGKHETHNAQPHGLKREVSPPAEAAPLTNVAAPQAQNFQDGLEAMINEESQRAESMASRTSDTAMTSAASTAAASLGAMTAAFPEVPGSTNTSTNSAASLQDASTTQAPAPSRNQIQSSTASKTNSALPQYMSQTMTAEKAKKKKHDAKTRLVYSDDTVPPEEKMSIRLRYAYARPADETETITGPISAGVTGPAGDTVRDPQDAHAGS